MEENNHTCGERRPSRRTRGITTAGMIVSMTTLLAFVAVAIDVAILNSCDTEARAAGDAAALAGAAELWDRSLLPTHLQSLGLPDSEFLRQTVWERQMLQCEEQTCQVASLNTVGGNPVALTSDDMAFATVNSESSLTVNCEFTNQRGNPVSRIIGRMLGLSDADLRVASQAVLDQRVYGFAATSTANAPVIPIVLDSDAWSTQVRTSSIVTIQIAADGSDALGSATLCSLQSAPADVIIDHRAIVSPTIVDNIRSGIRKSDLVNMPRPEIALSQDAGQSLDLAVNPVSLHLLQEVGNALQAINGRPRAWMLGAKVTGSDGNLACRVTSFVAAKILAVSVDGERLTAVLEPTLFSTSTALVRPGQVRNPWLAKVCLVR